MLVVKVGAGGANQATWLLLAHAVLVVLRFALIRNPLLIPPAVLILAMTALGWQRPRARAAELVGELRARLAAGEAVLGDGMGIAAAPSAAQAACR